MKSIIISASTHNYFHLLDDLLSSIELGTRNDGIDIGVLELGLDEPQRESLHRRNVKIVTPPWDYDLATFDEEPSLYLKATTARPHLPQHFPGYETYLWLDADTWVQNWGTVQLYLKTAESGAVACTPECDRSYTPFLVNTSVFEFSLNAYRNCVTNELAQLLAHFPTINSGAFAARATSPLWAKWASNLGQVYKAQRKLNFFFEQTVFNVTLRTREAEAAFLPSTCNWLCDKSRPCCSLDGTTWLDPQPPHQPIGILHLTANTKEGSFLVRDLTGASHQRSFRFSQKKPA